jgi:predicted transcriptional regulator
MSTTSLKLPDDLKEKTIIAAKYQGVTPHAFMVEAIRVAATMAEQRAQWVADATAARKAMLKSGQGFEADEVHTYLRLRAQGKVSTALKAKSWQG